MKQPAYRIILASKSPRRQYLLHELGLEFSIEVKDTDESFPPELQAQDIALYLCRKKAEAFRNGLSEKTMVIAADTIVWIDGGVLNKPAGHAEAVEMLKQLSGNRHQVFTGVCLMSADKTKVFYATSAVTFRKLSDSDIGHYITQFKPFDKAGSYGAQECLPEGMDPCSAEETAFLKKEGKLYLAAESRAAAGKTFPIITRIEGPYFNVMGLPIAELSSELEAF